MIFMQLYFYSLLINIMLVYKAWNGFSKNENKLWFPLLVTCLLIYAIIYGIKNIKRRVDIEK
jgi:drug/metabolite transporter superfamily protein YnfA